jgi:Uncharacterised protein family, YAP/Alf4/glomulin
MASLLRLIPNLAPFLQNGTAIDESLSLILRSAHAHIGGLVAAVELDNIIQPLIELCSTSPDPTQRNTMFVTLSQLLKSLPSRARLAIFTELLSPDTDPFPQMRVAAVGLVKESVLTALGGFSSSTAREPGQRDVFASPQLLTKIGQYILRSEPPDLLSQKQGTFDVAAFLESSEPVRLIECLGLYYTLLARDVSNKVSDSECPFLGLSILINCFIPRLGYGTGPRYVKQNATYSPHWHLCWICWNVRAMVSK